MRLPTVPRAALAHAWHAKDLHLARLPHVRLLVHVLLLLAAHVVLLRVVHLLPGVAAHVGHAALLHGTRLQVRHLLAAVAALLCANTKKPYSTCQYCWQL